MTDTYRDQTEALFDAHMGGLDNPNWGPSAQAVKNVFVGFPTRAFPIESISMIAQAADSVRPDHDFLPTLKTLVRARVLRWRSVRGVRLYEVNFAS